MMEHALYFIIPFGISLAFTPLVRHLALKNGFVAYPRLDRWHKNPTAVSGGSAIYLAAIISALVLLGIKDRFTFGLFIGATFLFIVGLADDKFHFTPHTKLFTQIIAGSIAISSGIVINLPGNSILTIPLTLLWIIAVTNAFNLLDNIDGLAAGIAAISSLMLFFSSRLFSNNPLGAYGLILSGAALGFLPYNFNPAKIFMGDSGSMFLGYSLAVISITGTNRHIASLMTTILIPVLILSVPIFDTLFVMLSRLLRGRNIFEGGKDHTSHRLVTLGLSQKKTVLLLYAVSIIFGSIAISYSKINIFVISILAFLALIVLLLFGSFLSESTSRETTRKNKPMKFGSITILNNMLMHKRRILEFLLDLGLICISYSSAYFLRFENQLLSGNLELLRGSLTWIIVIKMSVFFLFGLYRGVWRYISIPELLTIFKVVGLSSVASVLFLTFVFRFKEYSRAVFFIDWLILLFLVAGSRISFRVLGEFFHRLSEKGENVLIFGAGDAGEMVIRELKRNKILNCNPVGFIDDDPAKIGNKIQGIPVLGGRDQIRGIVENKGVKEIIIAMPSLGSEDFHDIVKICNACGIPHRKIKRILEKEEVIDFEKN